MKTTVVKINRQPFDVLIDRSTMFGNKFVIGRDGDRAEVITRHRQWLKTAEGSKAMANLHLLRGKKLGCHCKPLQCHGDNYVIACDNPDQL